MLIYPIPLTFLILFGVICVIFLLLLLLLESYIIIIIIIQSIYKKGINKQKSNHRIRMGRVQEEVL